MDELNIINCSELIVYHDQVIHGIKIDQKVYGEEIGSEDKISLEDDEFVKFMDFGRSTNLKHHNQPCNLALNTNKKAYGPFAVQNCTTSNHFMYYGSNQKFINYLEQHQLTHNLETDEPKCPGKINFAIIH